MASVVERRTTVTRTTHQGADQIKANLGRVSQEIARVRDRAREEANSLEKIKGMLDVGYLNDLIASIEELEVRMQTLQDEAFGAAGEVDSLRGELAREQDRLAKLWEAYKAQEDELNNTRGSAERVATLERTVEALRRENARLEPLSRYKSEYDAAVRENQTMRIEVENLNRDLVRTHDQLKQWEGEMATLREDASSKGRVGELEHMLDEERERLAKLYKVYEDQSTELKESTARLDAWEAWVQKVLPAMDTLCRHAGNAPRA
ncbi:MAG: hypothetical protein V4510_06375 [bacterium]